MYWSALHTCACSGACKGLCSNFCLGLGFSGTPVCLDCLEGAGDGGTSCSTELLLCTLDGTDSGAGCTSDAQCTDGDVCTSGVCQAPSTCRANGAACTAGRRR